MGNGHKRVNCPEGKQKKWEDVEENQLSGSTAKKNGHFTKECPAKKKGGLARNEKANVGINNIDEKYVSNEQSLFNIELQRNI